MNMKNELLNILAEAEDDVNSGRIAPINDTFNNLRILLNKDNSIDTVSRAASINKSLLDRNSLSTIL